MNYLKIKFFIAIICVVNSFSIIGQMDTHGEWPKPLFEKYTKEFELTHLVEIVKGDHGWFYACIRDFMIDHNGRMWLAGQYGLAYSDDKGLSWEKSITKYAIWAIYETRNHTLLASSNNSFVLRSEDGGKNWNRQKVFGKRGPTGRTSHGEHYSDIFYSNIGGETIIRTCQNSEQLLLSNDEGKNWTVIVGPDDPTSIHSLGDSLVIMFTYDRMYLSRDKCKTWQLSHKGLPPKAEDNNHDVIIEPIITEDDFILSVICQSHWNTSKGNLYSYNLKTENWSPYPSAETNFWERGYLTAAGKNRLLSFRFYQFTTGTQDSLAISMNNGKSWATLRNYHRYSPTFINNYQVDGNNFYFLSDGDLWVLHFPERCVDPMPELAETGIGVPGANSLTYMILPVDRFIESAKTSVYQKCACEGEGFSQFVLHLAEDYDSGKITLTNLGADREIGQIERSIDIKLKAGDYELLLYNSGFAAGCYQLNIFFEIGNKTKEVETVFYFY